MNPWLPIAIIPSALFAVSNYLDKYLIERYFKDQGNGAMIIFSSLIGVAVLPFVLIFERGVFSLSPATTALMIGNGMLYVIALVPYLAAMRDDDASVAVPLWQLIPVFGYLLGYFFLGESLGSAQVLGGLVVIAGAFLLSLDLSDGWPTLRSRTLLLMAFSSLLMALNGVLFKLFALDSSYGTTIFWDSTGLVVVGILYFIFSQTAREQFLSVLKMNTRGALALNTSNEVVNIIAMLILNYAFLLAPIALVMLANAAQPVFVLALGVTLTLLFPQAISESLARRVLVPKILAILVLVAGVILMDSSAL
jgi:drug/metabolite transporter (DMT)-like permease